MKNTFNNVLDAVGNTPLIRLNQVTHGSPHTFWAKLETTNPGGSVKDRIAVEIIEAAEKRGDLKPGGTIVEATSGNTGLGLAMVAAVKGYKCVFVMPEKISEEKRAILRAYGALVVITPSGVEAEDPRSHYSVAAKYTRETPGAFNTNQYHNPDNVTAHFKTTGPELWNQTDGKIGVFVGGAGTGGTLSGVGKYLKSKNKDVKIVMADPIGSILYDLYYHKKVINPPMPYKVEGIGEDMLPENVHLDLLDAVVQVTDKAAFHLTRDIIAKEGMCVGPSSGAALAAAIEFSKTLKTPTDIVVIFPDSGRAYMSKVFNDQWMKENGLL
jgi:cystathionine beta-synthase